MADGKKIGGAIEALVKAAEAMPASILGMETLSPEEMDKLDDKFFALIYKRRGLPPLRICPLVDGGNVYISALIWGLSKQSLPMAARRVAAHYIMQAAGKFGVTSFPFHDEIIDSANALTIVPMTNVIVDDSAVDNTMTKHAKVYLLPDSNKYPINDDSDIKIASSYFDNQHAAMDPPMAREYAANLAKLATEYKIEISEWVRKYAGECRNQSFSWEIEKRIDLTKEASHKEAWAQIEKIAETLDNKTLIELVWRMDKTASLEKFYGRVLPDPVQAVVTELGQIDKTAGVPAEAGITDTELRDVPIDTFTRYYGKSLADEFSRDPRAVYESIGNDNQAIIRKMLQGVL